MARGTLSPMPWFTGLDDNGNPLTGGKLYTYLAGTSVPAVTWTDVDLAVPHTNPIILDGGGRATIYLSPTQSYKYVLKNEFDVTIRSQDNVTAVPTLASNVDVGGVAGEQITAGQVVYLSDGSGGKIAGRWYLADADFPYASSLPQVGMAPENITSAATGLIRLIGRVDLPYAVEPGKTYYPDAAPGGLSPTPGANSRFIGVADSPRSIVISPDPPPISSGAVPYVYTYEIIQVADAVNPVIDCNASHMDGTKMFWVATGADRVLATPLNPKEGMRMVLAHQAGGGNRTLSLPAASFRFGTDITALTATVAGFTDYIAFIYHASKWSVVGYVKGYN